MELYVGGSFQGKRSYVLQKRDVKQADIMDWEQWEVDADCEKALLASTARLHDHFHAWVAAALRQGKNLEQMQEIVERWLDEREDCIIISDEVGSGIVPIKPDMREYRECVGRILCTLAARAKHMERIICGIGQVIL